MKRVSRLVPPLVWGALFLLAWEGFVKWRHIKPFLLPAPTGIRKALVANRHQIWDAASSTATNAFIGLLAGAMAGFAVALAAQRFRVLRALIAPLAAAFNTMPIVALGPIFYNLFGPTSEGARRFVVALVAFFPVFVNTLKGLTQVDPVHEELMRSYAAGPGAFLRLVRFPNAMPFAITGLRVAASLSVIAAVVVEYFGGLQNGLGSRVASAMKLSQAPKGWAYITSAIAMGLLFYLGGLVLERVAMPWQARRRSSQEA
jgi:NitT/TauT family transport system permease protein